ncbi:MAG: hypothetical protein FJ386_06410 [Verrucomicrobia bacterium]|nr:hypothetical protein [Verrucomicrobiota bacterium]
MAVDLDFLASGDKPALLALSDHELLSNMQSVLASLEYKMHVAADHEEFDRLFSGVQYPIVVIEDLFCATTRAENRTLTMLQHMPMQLRRHAVVVLIGDSYETMNTMQAYQLSVHAVVHRGDLPGFGRILLKTLAENDFFLSTYRDIQNRLAIGQSL